MTQALSVTLPFNTIYVSGTVNGAEAVWTLTRDSMWQAIVPRAANDIYHVDLTIINGEGASSQTEFTLYYGLMSLITDRTQRDVDRVIHLSSIPWNKMTVDEQAEWASGMKGAYNATDLNRVGAAVNYIVNRLNNLGYNFSITARIDWKIQDIPTQPDMDEYLANIKTLRNALTVLSSTPEVPTDMDKLTYIEANNIEQILLDLDLLITNISKAWCYAGDLYSGEI